MNPDKKKALNIRHPNFILCLLFTLCLVVFLLSTRTKFNINYLRDSFIPGAGFLGPVPEYVIDMEIIVNRLGLKNFALGGRLNEDPFLLQRSFEYLYPIRINHDSDYIFFVSVDPKKENCDFIESERAVELFYCK
jgi:hypothetical protein